MTASGCPNASAQCYFGDHVDMRDMKYRVDVLKEALDRRCIGMGVNKADPQCPNIFEDILKESGKIFLDHRGRASITKKPADFDELSEDEDQ